MVLRDDEQPVDRAAPLDEHEVACVGFVVAKGAGVAGFRRQQRCDLWLGAEALKEQSPGIIYGSSDPLIRRLLLSVTYRDVG